MLAVIGSLALRFAVDDDVRDPNDIDLVGDYDEIIVYLKSRNCKTIMPFAEGKKIFGKNDKTIFECEIAWPGSTSAALLELIENDPNTEVREDMLFPSLNVLYMLKMTHRFRKNNPHFLKTMRDIHDMRGWGAEIQDDHKKFYKKRLKETLSYKHPKLNQGKKDFFTDDVPYVYDHDSIHRAVAVYDRPAYTYYMDDDAEVNCSKEKFFGVGEAVRLCGVYEEACVLALERSQIPHPGMDRLDSFKIALEKVCTSITSGWFREYAWENYDKVMQLYHSSTEMGENYKDMFDRALAKGDVILPHMKEAA